MFHYFTFNLCVALNPCKSDSNDLMIIFKFAVICSVNILYLFLMVFCDIKITDSPGPWHLGMNINPCDGHNFGYGGPWADNVDVGDAGQALTADYLNNTVWNMVCSYISLS